MDDSIKQTIISDLGLSALPKDKQEDALLRVGKIIFQGVLLRVVEGLDENKQEALEKILGGETPSEEALLAFLGANVPHLQDIVKEEVAKFKEESAKIMAK